MSLQEELKGDDSIRMHTWDLRFDLVTKKCHWFLKEDLNHPFVISCQRK